MHKMKIELHQKNKYVNWREAKEEKKISWDFSPSHRWYYLELCQETEFRYVKYDQHNLYVCTLEIMSSERKYKKKKSTMEETHSHCNYT